jgi:hypothetical protein
MAAEVRVLNPEPEGVLVSKTLQPSDLKDALAEVENSGFPKREANEIEILAWSTKAHPHYIPPALNEEAIVLARWKSPDSWGLFCLLRYHTGVAFFSQGWTAQKGVERLGLAWAAKFDARPTEDQIVDFVRKTNFGNNECLSEILVLGVFVYGDQMKKLHQELARGLPKEERKRREEAFYKHPGRR